MDDDQPVEPSLTAWLRSLQRVAVWMVRVNRAREPSSPDVRSRHSLREMRCLPGDMSHHALEAARWSALFFGTASHYAVCAISLSLSLDGPRPSLLSALADLAGACRERRGLCADPNALRAQPGGKVVTGDQARALKPGDYLCWSESGELGVVVRVNRFSVTVRWSSGRLNFGGHGR